MPRNAETLFNLLHEARQQNGGTLNKEQWLKVAQGFLDSDRLPKRPSVQMLTQAGDEAWIAYLESLPHLQGIDIKREIGKCQLWTQTNTGKGPTRRRIINWLNKAERTVLFNGQGQSSFTPQRREVTQSIPEPQGWSARIQAHDSLGVLAGRDWNSLNPYYQKQIVKLCATT